MFNSTRILCTLTLCGLLATFMASAQDASSVDSSAEKISSEKPMKIGYFDFLKLVNSVPQAKLAEERLSREFEPRQTKITEMDKSIQAEAAELEKNALLSSDAERVEKERALRMKDRELKLLYQEYQEELELRRNEETRAIQKLVYQAVVKIAKEEGFDLILEQGTVYASPRADITAKVLQRVTNASDDGK